jgi:hypothetical protein
MKKKKSDIDKEESVRLACGIFIAMFFGSLFAGIYNLNNGDQTFGILFSVCALVFLGITLLAYFKPLLSSIIGLIFYTGLISWACAAFPDFIFYTGRKGSFFHYFILGFILIIAALVDSYRGRDKNKQSKTAA